MSRTTHTGSRTAHSGARSAHPGRNPRVATTPTFSGITPAVGQNDFSLAWTVSTPAQGWIEYGLSAAGPYSVDAYPSQTVHETGHLTSHVQVITGLLADTSYDYLIHAVDQAGKVGTSGPWVFHTQPVIPGPVSGAPIILNTPAMTNVTAGSATSTVNVDQPCQAYIEYGTSAGGPYPQSTLAETTYDWSTHTQTPGASSSTLTPLAPSTTYYGKWVLTNAAAQVTRSAQMTWTTLASGVTPPVDPPPSGGTYPATSTLQTGTVPSGAQTLPSVGVWTTDTTTPGGNTRYVRIDSGSRGGHLYATHTPWNSDMTWFWDHYAGNLLRTSDWSVVASRSSVIPSEPQWAWTNPVRMYGMLGATGFGYTNMSTGAQTLLFTFTGYSEVRLGLSDGCQSRDDRIWLFQGTTTGGQRRLIRLDRVTGGVADACSITTTRNISVLPNNCKMGPLGTGGAIVNWEGSPQGTGPEAGLALINAVTLAHVRNLNPKGDHTDVGYDSAGREIAVGSFGGAGTSLSQNVYAYRMDPTVTTAVNDVGALLPSTSGYQFQQGHVSLQSRDLNGWAFLSSFSHSLTQPGRGQVIAVPTDGSARAAGAGIRVYGWHRSDSTTTNGNDAYERSPFACPNHDGTRVAVKSKWDMTDDVTGPFYGFVFSA